MSLNFAKILEVLYVYLKYWVKNIIAVLLIYDETIIFRDDVVFFIFLYQRYIYKMDPTRFLSSKYALIIMWLSGSTSLVFLLRCWRRRRRRVLWLTPLLLQLSKAVSLRVQKELRRLPNPSKSRKRPKKLTKEWIVMGIFCCLMAQSIEIMWAAMCITLQEFSWS